MKKILLAFLSAIAALLLSWIFEYLIHLVLYRSRYTETFGLSNLNSIISEREDQCRYDSELKYDYRRNPKYQFLCRIRLDHYCSRISPAEELKHFYIVAPIYSMNQKLNSLLYELHANFKYYVESLGANFVQIEYTIGD
jgi:hypothetical protein